MKNVISLITRPLGNYGSFLFPGLLARLPAPPLDASDEEASKRDCEMDENTVKPLSHEEFLVSVGR